MSRLAAGIAVTLAVGCLGAGAVARAQGARAAVLVTAAEGLDPFVSAYAFEVASAVLTAARRTIAPQAVTSARLAARTPAGRACVSEPSCLVAVATDVGAPTIVVIDLSAGARGAFVARVTSFEITERGPVQIEQGDVQGTETAIAERVRDIAARLGERPAPCTVSVASHAGTTRIGVGESSPDTRLVRFLSPGTHRLRIDAPRRTGWRGELTCRAGRRYRVDVR